MLFQPPKKEIIFSYFAMVLVVSFDILCAIYWYNDHLKTTKVFVVVNN